MAYLLKSRQVNKSVWLTINKRLLTHLEAGFKTFTKGKRHYVQKVCLQMESSSVTQKRNKFKVMM